MRHVGLKARMLAAGSVLFAFWALLALVAVRAFGLSIPLAVALTLGFAGLQYLIGTKLTLRSVGAEDLDPDRYSRIHRSVERLADEMGIDKPDLKIAEMGVPNAFAVGRRGAGTVVVSRELLSLLDHDELEGVLAHELAHIRNRDVLVMVLGQSIATMVGLAVQFAIIFAGDSDIADFVVGYLAGTVAQMLVMVFVLAISRYREYVADGDAADHVGGRPMADALRKIDAAGEQAQAQATARGRGQGRGRGRGRRGRQPRQQGGTPDQVSALCISGGDRGLLASVFATHPPVEKRIERLEGGN